VRRPAIPICGLNRKPRVSYHALFGAGAAQDNSNLALTNE
jgi:hypothetical protein